MLDLKNLGVVEMSSQEVIEIEGGLRLRISFFGFNIYSYETGVGSTTDFW